MKKYLLCLILCIIGLYLFADGPGKTSTTPYSQEHMKQKVTRFKAKHGFQGEINYDSKRGILISMVGTLPNCVVRDTSSARAMSKALFTKYAADFGINIDQLSLVRNGQFLQAIDVTYSQVIDGYKIEPHAGISVEFRMDRLNYVQITSSLIPNLNINTSNPISRTEAEKILTNIHGNKSTRRSTPLILVSRMYKSQTSPIDKAEPYKLCWRLSYSLASDDYVMYIDAITGKVIGTYKVKSINDVTFRVKGQKYSDISYEN